jgi:hypothetical protein
MEKNGMLTEDSKSDFDKTKKAEWYDADGFCVADNQNKEKLAAPRPIKDLNTDNREE